MTLGNFYDLNFNILTLELILCHCVHLRKVVHQLRFYEASLPSLHQLHLASFREPGLRPDHLLPPSSQSDHFNNSRPRKLQLRCCGSSLSTAEDILNN